MTLLDWQEKIKQKRKTTSFSSFLKEIVSWKPLVLNKNQGFVSRYPESKRIGKILNNIAFDEQRATLTNSWFEYDFNKNLFENIKPLFESVNRENLIQIVSEENCAYSDVSIFSKNVYLSFTVVNSCENIYYSNEIKDNCKNIYNSVMVWDSCENIYMCLWVFRSFNIFYAKNITDSSDIWFSSNLAWCHECIFCDGLKNRSYCINNKEYGKEDYLREKSIILSNKELFFGHYNKLKFDWNLLIECEDVKNWLFNYRIKDWRNVIFAWTKNGNQDFYDVLDAGSPSGNDFYAVMWAWPWSNIYNSLSIIWSNVYYSYFLENCSYCLWCINLKNKNYCILNKQYSEKDWYEMVDRIFTQMEKDNILWGMFPWYLNPFYFNDTLANMLWNFDKDEIQKEGFLWRNEEIKVDIPNWLEIVEMEKIDILNFDESILTKVIKNKKWDYYRIVKQEYEFLKKYNLPLPNLHWLDRIKLHFNWLKI